MKFLYLLFALLYAVAVIVGLTFTALLPFLLIKLFILFLGWKFILITLGAVTVAVIGISIIGD